MKRKQTSCHSADFSMSKMPHDGESGNTSRPVPTGDKSIVGLTICPRSEESGNASQSLIGDLGGLGRIKESDMDKRLSVENCGRFILESMKEPMDEKASLWAVVAWIAILVLIVVTLFWTDTAHAFTTEASYFTYASCIKEGTSGICANGERLDDEAFLAASWDFPLGETIRVTNKANGKSIEVKVADRGPAKRLYKKGRRLDLSKAAFSALSDNRLDKGILQVEVTNE